MSNSQFTIHNSQLKSRHRASCIVNCALVFLFFLLSFNAQSQEFNCSVQVVSGSIQGSDKSIFETLQTSIREFLNNRHWTNDKFLNQERIECSMMINITQRISTDKF